MNIQRIERIDEVWKSLDDFSNYEVSNRGRIRSKDRETFHRGSKTMMKVKGKVMKQRWNKACKCYFLDLLDNNGKRRTVYPHKEVAKAFCINVLPELYTMIIHLDNNPRNNDSTNLEWVSASDHMAFQFESGNKDNYKVWKIRKRKYKNGFKPETTFRGRPRKEEFEEVAVAAYEEELMEV